MPSEDQLLLLIEKDRQKSQQISPEIGASSKCKETCIILVILFSNMLGLGPLHTTKIFTTIFTKKSLQKSLPIYKTVESVSGRQRYFCSFSCSVRGPLVVDMMPLTFFTYEAKKRGLLDYQTGIVIGCYDFGRLISGPLCASVVS